MFYNEQLKYSLRLGITGGLTAIVAYVIDTSYFGWMWMAVTSFIVMDLRTTVTIKAGSSRAMGTCAGAVLGVILAYQLNTFNLIDIMLAFSIIGCVCAIAHANNKNLKLMAMTAAVVYIMCSQPEAQTVTTHFWEIGFERCINILIAIILAILVATFIFPTKAANILEKNITTSLREIANNIHQLSRYIHSKEESNKQNSEENHNTMNLKLIDEASWEYNKNQIALQNFTKINNLILSAKTVIHEMCSIHISHNNNLITKIENELLTCLKQLEELFYYLGNKNKKYFANPDPLNLAKLNLAVVQLNQQFNNLRTNEDLQRFSSNEVNVLYQFITSINLLANEAEKLQ